MGAINRTLGTEIECGPVTLTSAAQAHAAKRHPDDYGRCQPHLASVIANPLFVGDDCKNPGKIELIGRVASIKTAILVAINLERNERGEYEVASFYPVAEGKIEKRQAKGYLKRLRIA